MILHNIDQERKTSPEEAVILMGHGSRDSEGAEEFLTFVERVASRLSQPVYPGFLELADPPIATIMNRAVQTGAKNIIAVPWMLLGAGHVKNDLPSAIQVARRRYPQVTIQYGTPITVQPELLSVLADRLAAIDPHNGIGSPETAVLLVQRGSSDPDANAEVYRAARLLWEGRNFATVEVAFSGITKPTIQEGLLRCFAPGVTRILVLPYFLYTGILVKRIAQIVAGTSITHPEYEFRVAAHMGQDTRLDELAVRLIEQTRNGKASMSCDLCQYRTPLFGRESFVGMPQVSDHSHGLRGTTTDEHLHPEHCSVTDWQALQKCVTEAGIMNVHELTEALASWQSQQTKPTPPPYVLLALPGHAPTAALRWDWKSSHAHEFTTWCMDAVQERFGISWQVEYEDEDAHLGPHYLRMILDRQQEQCDWQYLNQSHWMGAFCTIANRLLNAVGLTALSLETGWFDTIVVFCRKSHAEEVLYWFPEAE